ncbi:MAG: hypothetical protein DRJ34_05820, partial [Thermoprotei archaeon]
MILGYFYKLRKPVKLKIPLLLLIWLTIYFILLILHYNIITHKLLELHSDMKAHLYYSLKLLRNSNEYKSVGYLWYHLNIVMLIRLLGLELFRKIYSLLVFLNLLLFLSIYKFMRAILEDRKTATFVLFMVLSNNLAWLRVMLLTINYGLENLYNYLLSVGALAYYTHFNITSQTYFNLLPGFLSLFLLFSFLYYNIELNTNGRKGGCLSEIILVPLVLVSYLTNPVYSILGPIFYIFLSNLGFIRLTTINISAFILGGALP